MGVKFRFQGGGALIGHCGGEARGFF
jgi:hypothetical protein